MSFSKTKIAQELSPAELAEFCAALRDVPHGDMAARILELAAEKGISIGKTAAYEFKNKEALPWLRRLEMRQEKSKMLQEYSSADGTGARLADAAADELSQCTFDFVTNLDGKLDLDSKEGREIYAVITKGIKSLRDGDRAMLKQLQEQVTETKEDLTNPQLTEQQRAERMRARFGV